MDQLIDLYHTWYHIPPTTRTAPKYYHLYIGRFVVTPWCDGGIHNTRQEGKRNMGYDQYIGDSTFKKQQMRYICNKTAESILLLFLYSEGSHHSNSFINSLFLFGQAIFFNFNSDFVFSFFHNHCIQRHTHTHRSTPISLSLSLSSSSHKHAS